MVEKKEKWELEAFVSLGKALNAQKSSWESWAAEARAYNQWFIPESIVNALESIVKMLERHKLESWLERYVPVETPKNVGVVMAGNIPMVGFHDMMTVLLSGHKLHAKVSSQDPVLIKNIASLLTDLAPEFSERIDFVEKMNGMDAVIATGSDNSARYFNYYFSGIPHIIRRNRSSIAVLNGKETTDELRKLGKDIFTYFGLGCRNISKVYVPENYDWTVFFEAIEEFSHVGHHHKYHNNYDYNKSVYLINSVLHKDNGFLLLTESKELVSPLSVLFFEQYVTVDGLTASLEAWKEKVQAVSSADAWFPESIPFGTAQCPDPWEYADGVDTMQFLTGI